jgi:hypothetical protein
VPFTLLRNSRKTGPARPPEFLTLFGGTLALCAFENPDDRAGPAGQFFARTVIK